MTTRPASTSIPKPMIGVALIVAALGLGLFGYAHRPPEGLMDALQRIDSWAFQPGVYYAILLLAALIAFGGAFVLVKSFRR